MRVFYPRYIINPDRNLAATIWQFITSAALLWIALVTPLQAGIAVFYDSMHLWSNSKIQINALNKGQMSVANRARGLISYR